METGKRKAEDPSDGPPAKKVKVEADGMDEARTRGRRKVLDLTGAPGGEPCRRLPEEADEFAD